jgi:IS5 family transposase
VFPEEMKLVVPWKALLGLIEPHYPTAGRGRRPYPLESMLRVHLMQNWFALSDPAMEEALYEIASLRTFARLSLGEAIPDETTILNFRHPLEANAWLHDKEQHVWANSGYRGLHRRAWTARICSGISLPARAASPKCPRGAARTQSRGANTARPAFARRSSIRSVSSSASSG